MDLLIEGTVAFDSIYTPNGQAERVVGGAALYATWAASYFTEHIQLLSIVGGDFPASELDLLKARGVDLQGLEIKEDGLSFYWEGKYLANLNSRETLRTDLNVLDDFDPVLPEDYKRTKYIMLGNVTPSLQSQVLNQLEEKPKFVGLDTMNLWIDIAKDELLSVIERVNILMINDEEARLLSGIYSLKKAAKVILTMGPEFLVIKKGEHGALLFHKDDIFFAPALPLNNVEDPTGAGDSFAGGLMGYIAMTNDTSYENLKRAMIYGSVMASFCVEEFSINKLKNLTSEDLSGRLDEFVQLVKFDV